MKPKYKGVQVRGNRVRIHFTYCGERRYITMDGEPDAANLERCGLLVKTIEQQIKAGTFVFDETFPSGPKGTEFGLYVKDWLESKRITVSKSTFMAYETRVNTWVLKKWENTHTEQIDYRSILRWVQTELMPQLSNKTIRDIYSIMSQSMMHYRRCTGSKHDPMEGVTTGLSLSCPDKPDPFSKAEIKKLLSVDPDSPINRMIKFAVYTGVRVSELIAIAWEDVDLSKGVITINRARVSSTYKVTKTRYSTRKLKLMRPALEALTEQYQATGDLPPVEVEVFQRDNRTTRTQDLRFVFHHPKTKRAFSTADNYRNNFWNAHIKQSGVRHRGPNNARHTYASHALSTGAVPLAWISAQLGHTGTDMLFRHYSTWIDEDQLDATGILERALGVD